MTYPYQFQQSYYQHYQNNIPSSHTPAFPRRPQTQHHQQQQQQHSTPPPYPSYPYHPASQSPSYGTNQLNYNAEAGPSRSKGRDYLLSLQTSMSNLDLGVTYPHQLESRQRTSLVELNKPLPQLPIPPNLASRPWSSPDVVSASAKRPDDDERGSERFSNIGRTTQSTEQPSQIKLVRDAVKTSDAPTSSTSYATRHLKSTTPKAFRPSTTLYSPSKLHPPHSEPKLTRPYSDPLLHTTPIRRSKMSAGKNHRNPIDVIVISSDSDSDCSGNNPAYVTARSPARHKRASSEMPIRPAVTDTSDGSNGTRKATPRKGNRSSVKCAGFTRKGAPCQRLVKAEAPYLSMYKHSLETDDDKVEARYCKDHAGMICSAKGFYWRSKKEDVGVWIDFDDYIPDSLGQQTKTLLRMTMESSLTDKETPGFLYAYELRDLQNDQTSFFKVGRTDNVPRRIGEWTTRCRSHTPTLRDIFPLSPPTHFKTTTTDLNRTPTLPTSYLPGAFRQTTNPHRTCPAVKRWERLVHLELADLASQHAPMDYENLKEKCAECQAVHREIFPLGSGERVYQERVMEVICRWERFVRKISESSA